MSTSNDDGTVQQAPVAKGTASPSGEPAAGTGTATKPKGKPGRKPRGTVPAIVTEPPDHPDPSHELTWRQRKVLQVIRESVQRRGYPPSMREIGEAVGLTSTSSVSYQLSTLQAKGYLRRDAGRPKVTHPAVDDTVAERSEFPAAEPFSGPRQYRREHLAGYFRRLCTQIGG